MRSVEDFIKDEYGLVISKTDTHEVGEELRRIAAEAGLGVAILVAWQHGLTSGHIPRMHGEDGGNPEDPQILTLPPRGACRYVFVHIPVRQFRRDKNELVKRGIMNKDADPAWFIYHEDGLVGTFSFQNPPFGLTEVRIRELLDAFAQAGILVRANINNRQIQFKDLVAKRRIEQSGEEVYVRAENRPLSPQGVYLPAGLRQEKIWAYITKALKDRSACNYCSVQALTPNQATIHSAHVYTHARRWEGDLATVRNYQLGFTFAPIGDPQKVCHFLAWDFPHINDLVMNMEPQVYSFSDLIRLVRVINQDIREFCADNEVKPPRVPISGACNHWAGNSLYHQHYQFFRLARLPLVRARADRLPLVTYQGVEVRKVAAPWPSPAYLIRSVKPGGDEDVMHVADRVAREWHVLSDGEDLSYGNGIAIKNHTQNLFVTLDADRLNAVFIPRHRGKCDTSDRNPIQKRNAGVLEMMGYFVIDDPGDFGKLKKMSPKERRRLGDSWLSELAPEPEAIREFEANVSICLSKRVTPYEERIEKLLGDTEDWRHEAWTIASNIQHDRKLGDQQREHLYRELLWAVLESSQRSISEVVQVSRARA
jgi:hypothetical protein